MFGNYIYIYQLKNKKNSVGKGLQQIFQNRKYMNDQVHK